MKFTLEIRMDNAAFEDDPQGEVARILENVVTRLHGGSLGGRVMDINGNKVGTFEIDQED